MDNDGMFCNKAEYSNVQYGVKKSYYPMALFLIFSKKER